MLLLRILLWPFGFNIVEDTAKNKPAVTETQKPAVEQKNTIPILEDTTVSGNLFVQEPTMEEVIKYYQNLRQSMVHDAAWKMVTQKYGWDAATSEKKLAEFKQLAANAKQQQGSTGKQNREL